MPRSLGSLLPVLLFGCALVLLPAASHATQVTLTFDSAAGAYDPNHPGGGLHGPYDWIEAEARYAGFWHADVGTPWATTEIADTHLGGTGNGAPQIGDFQHSWRNGLQGSEISILDGRSFDIVSIDVILLRRQPEAGVSYAQQVLPWSFAADDIQLLIAEGLNPATPDFASYESQFTSFDIDDGSVFDLGGGAFDPDRPAGGALASTVFPTGFQGLTRFYLAHSGARVVIDSIVLDVHEQQVGAVVPEPGTGILVAAGLGVLCTRRTALSSCR